MAAARPLFGGAASINVPASFVDISQFRTVPDNQEVFAEQVTDDSIVIELLEQAEAPDVEMAKYHFQVLAEHNEVAAGAAIIEVDEPCSTLSLLAHAPGSSCRLLRGVQLVAKYNEEARNAVQIYMAVVRMPHVTTDLIISWNHPTVLAPGSSSATRSGPGEPRDIQADFMQLINSFQLHDWGLFG